MTKPENRICSGSAPAARALATLAHPLALPATPRRRQIKHLVQGLLASAALLVASVPASALTTSQEILREAAAPNSETNHPLPLMGSWNPGSQWDSNNLSYTPTWQMQMIASGHHLLPWFGMPQYNETSSSGDWSANIASMQTPMQQAASLGLPISFVGTQWEQNLYQEDKFITLPALQNPNVQVPGVVPGTTIGAVKTVTGGTGYKVGDVLAVLGGTYTAPAQLIVASVSTTGAITATNVYAAGAYSVLPTNPVSATGGSGTGAAWKVYDGAIKAQVSPFGAVGPWQSVGAEWGTGQLMQLVQSWYPNPPLVLFISNNEASRLPWTDATKDQHYLDLYGSSKTDEFKREVVAKGWIDRYRALQQAWRSSLTPAWQGTSKFVAYEAFGPKYFGRWSGWMAYSLYNTNRIDPSPLAWDGGSPSYYLAFNDPPSDAEVFSPQVEAMNYDFMLKEAYSLNPNFWFELSTWNGCDWYPTSTAPSTNGDCQTLATNTPDFTDQRYGGMVQFGMWLTRPRVVRDFRMYGSPRSQSAPLFDIQMNAVDRIYTNPVLTSFWRSGLLVANTSRPHPYQSYIPTEYQSANRMFMLATNLDPPTPWSLSAQLPVFSLARVIGTSPTRQWLVYAFAPNGTQSGVKITIPGYQTVTADATVAGAFYLVDEAGGSVTPLGNGDPIVTSSDTTAPTAAITAPVSGSTVAAGPVSVSVAASDNVAVSRVELWVQNQLVGTTNVTPYLFSWDASKITGNVTLAANAYDAAGNKGTSAGVNVYVSSPLQAKVTSPAADSSIGGTVMLGAMATELVSNLAVSGLQISIDGKMKCATSSTTILSCSWNTRSVKRGNHTISATATDTGGNTVTQSITVTKYK